MFDIAYARNFWQFHRPIQNQYRPYDTIKNQYLYDNAQMYSLVPDSSRLHNFGSVGIPVARPDRRSSLAQNPVLPEHPGMVENILNRFQVSTDGVGNNNAFGIIPLDERAMNYLLYRRLIVSCPISRNAVSNIIWYVVTGLYFDVDNRYEHLKCFY